MINLCLRCHKPIDDGEEVEMTVVGTYHRIASEKAFRLDKDIVFKTGTLAHVECATEEIGA